MLAINNLKDSLPKLAMITACIMVLIINVFCGSIKRNQRSSLKTITVFTKYDFIKVNNGEFIQIQDSCKISYLGDYILYHVPYVYEIVKAIVKNDTIEEKILSSEVKYFFFIYKPGDALGFKFDSLKAEKPHLFRVDSLLNAESFAKAKFYDPENDSLIQTAKDTKPNTICEIYIPRIKYDDTYPDSSYLYFSKKVKSIPFSFSPFLDSTKNKKLFKVVFIYNPITKGKYNFDIPRRQFIFEIKRSTPPKSKEIIDLFEKAKRLYE